jgi:transposase
MEYFAGLDVSMAETHVCVVTGDGVVVHEGKVPSTPTDIAAALAQVPSCQRVVFETGRMAPMLYHGLSQLGLPVVCVESRQAYQALKLLATHKTDRNDARGLAHLARTGFLQTGSCEVPAGTRCPVADHRSQETGRSAGHFWRTRSAALPWCSASACHVRSAPPIRQALQASEDIPGLSAATRGLTVQVQTPGGSCGLLR